MYFSCWKSSKVYPGIRTLNFNVWHASCQGPCSEAWRWSWLGAFVRSLAGNPLTRARGGEQRKRVLSLLMWPWCDSSAIVHMLIIFLRYKHCFLRKLNKNLHLILDNDFHTSFFFSPPLFCCCKLELFSLPKQ